MHGFKQGKIDDLSRPTACFDGAQGNHDGKRTLSAGNHVGQCQRRQHWRAVAKSIARGKT